MSVEPEDFTFFGIVIAIALVAIAGFLFGRDGAMRSWQEDAVKHHAAEFYLDSKHERQWRWLDQPVNEEGKK